MHLCTVPGAPVLILSLTSADSVTVSWTVSSGSVVERYDLMWSITGVQQPLVTFSDTSSANTYTIEGLDVYDNVTVSISVTAVNAVGSNSSTPLIIHSDIPHNRPTESDSEDEDTNITIGAIIGGAVGIFLISLVLGIVTTFVVYKLRRMREKTRR